VETASLFRFAREDQDELIPSRVTDALCRMMVLHHLSHVQIFDSNRIDLPHDLECRLVMKIRPLAPNLQMPFGELSNCLTSAVAPLVRTTRYSQLRRFQDINDNADTGVYTVSYSAVLPSEPVAA
jgi:hypothetical protein